MAGVSTPYPGRNPQAQGVASIKEAKLGLQPCQIDIGPRTFDSDPGSPAMLAACWFVSGQEVAGEGQYQSCQPPAVAQGVWQGICWSRVPGLLSCKLAWGPALLGATALYKQGLSFSSPWAAGTVLKWELPFPHFPYPLVGALKPFATSFCVGQSLRAVQT